jgi:hypothetical protein
MAVVSALNRRFELMRRPSNHDLTLSAYAALAISALGLGLLLVARVRQLGIVHHDSGGASQNVVYGVQTLLATGRLYFDPSRPPFPVMQYSPLYYYLTAAVAWLGRVHADDVLRVYTLCRAVALAFNVGMGVLLYALVRLFSVPRLAAGMVAIWGFSFIQNTDFCRPDSLYHLLAIAAVCELVRYAKSQHAQARSLYLAIGLSVLALFSKQSGLVLAPIIFSYLLAFDRRWRRLATALGVYLGAGGILFFAFAKLNGGFFPLWENVQGGIDNGVDLDWFYRRIVELYTRELAGWSALILPACMWFRLKRVASSAGPALAFAVLWYLVFGFLTALKWGSMPSYFTPYLTLGFCAFSIALLSPEYRATEDPRLAKFAFASAVVFGLVLNVPVSLKASWIKDESDRFAHASEVARFLRNEKHLQPGDGVMTLLVGELLLDTSFLNNLLFRNAIMPQKDVVTCCAFKNKRFDYSAFQSRANSGLIKYLIKARDNRLDTYAGARLTQFRKLTTLFEYDVYEQTP